MKKTIYPTLIITAVIVFWYGCAKSPEVTTGDIYGVITDKATGEPIKSAGVLLNPTGTKTVTGNDGEYTFTELKTGDYTIQVTKTGYTDLLNYKIKVTAGQTNKGDVQIEKLPPSLRVVNDSGKDIDTLDFGSAEADLARSFNIFNDGSESLDWEITKTAEWITGISKASGTLNAGATQAVIITIDRLKLAGGENITSIHITSNNGSKQLTITATGANRTLPVLNTLDVTNIASNSASLHGVITATGSPSYTERGFVYATSSMPTIENTINKLTVAVNSTVEYSANITGLTLDQTYYVRAYAINSVGTAYSTNEVNFAPQTIPPTLNTQAVTNINIGAGTATFNGTILTVGDPAYIERGFVYGITHNPTIDDNKKIASGTGTGAFSYNVTNIAEGSIYYVRAYTSNVKGTVYGDEVLVDFNATMPVIQTNEVTNKNIGAGTATLNGNIVSLGDLPCSERGFVYSTTSNPTIDDNKKIVSGMATGTYSGNITNFLVNNVYYVRAYITNNKQTIYGDNATMDFSAINPQVTTQAVTNIDATTATFNGNIISTGDPIYTEKGFVYSTNTNPTIDDTRQVVTGSGTGAFSANITGLTIQTTYYIRTYVISNSIITYGSQVNFVTESPYYYRIPNTNLLVMKEDITSAAINWSDANSLCESSVLGGYNDWRLPTIDELLVIFSNKNLIGNFLTSSTYINSYPCYPMYWSSIYYGTGCGDQSGDCYKGIRFDDGSISNGAATQTKSGHNYNTASFYYTIHYCRAVRTLP